MYKPISEQIKAVKIKPEYELTGNQLLELKNGSSDFYQAIYNAFKFGYLKGRESVKTRGVMFIAHHFFGDHLRLMFWQHSGLHK